MSAESVGGSTPGVRVTWSTTAPPECVASVRVVFRRSTHGSVVASYTTTNTSVTQVIQSQLQCATEYYVQVFVIGDSQSLGGVQEQSIQERVVVGGKENCVHDISFATMAFPNPIFIFWSYLFFIHIAYGWVITTAELQ